ncbi:type II secretion system F family protein [Streptomyces sp. SP17BM10]|uniref:type II secretion system F family protein n=1 Tax=Streptomyces sp. SP17BM10 TaxID=3002530 RepID=UPI002E780FF3|nr:type II secretion system F family protein [Streptomyces sp. SP17BM10]MEE1782712.1 type II secretion system F family protein [Streptomyces sp. SP17BM10]
MTRLLFGLVAGMLLVGGLVGAVVGIVGTTAPPMPGPASRFRAALTSGERDERARARARARLLASAVGGVLLWVVTGWFILGLILVLVVAGLPWLLASTSNNKAQIEKLDALAEWTRRLSDVLMLGMGLEQAIISSRKTAPVVLQEPVGELAARLLSGWRPADALRAFANTLGDATADKVISALILKVSDRGPGLAQALNDLADTIREEVRQRRDVEAERAKPRTTVKWLTWMTVGIVVLGSFATDYVQPYGTFLGQVVLAVLLLGFVGVLSWMRSLASYKPTPRFLIADPRSSVKFQQAAAPTAGQPGPVQEVSAR